MAHPAHDAHVPFRASGGRAGHLDRARPRPRGRARHDEPAPSDAASAPASAMPVRRRLRGRPRCAATRPASSRSGSPEPAVAGHRRRVLDQPAPGVLALAPGGALADGRDGPSPARRVAGVERQDVLAVGRERLDGCPAVRGRSSSSPSGVDVGDEAAARAPARRRASRRCGRRRRRRTGSPTPSGRRCRWRRPRAPPGPSTIVAGALLLVALVDAQRGERRPAVRRDERGSRPRACAATDATVPENTVSAPASAYPSETLPVSPTAAARAPPRRRRARPRRRRRRARARPRP